MACVATLAASTVVYTLDAAFSSLVLVPAVPVLRERSLLEMAAAFAVEHLAPGGSFCSKVFQGGATKEVLDLLKANFTSVKHIKPPASRAGSPEIFVVAKGFKG